MRRIGGRGQNPTEKGFFYAAEKYSEMMAAWGPESLSK